MLGRRDGGCPKIQLVQPFVSLLVVDDVVADHCLVTGQMQNGVLLDRRMRPRIRFRVCRGLLFRCSGVTEGLTVTRPRSLLALPILPPERGDSLWVCTSPSRGQAPPTSTAIRMFVITWPRPHNQMRGGQTECAEVKHLKWLPSPAEQIDESES